MIKKPPANARDTDTGFYPWAGKIPWKRKWQPAPIVLPGKFHGQRSLEGYSPSGHKLSDMTEHTHTHTEPTESNDQKHTGEPMIHERGRDHLLRTQNTSLAPNVLP